MNHFHPLLESKVFESRESQPWVVAAPSKNWRFEHAGIWLAVTNGDAPAFGWKVHVSAILTEAPRVLAIVSEIAFQTRCSFKYLAGVDAFLSLHFKNASRLQSGKFIALYPRSEYHAADLMERLHESLSQFKGLDVLTDRSFRGSASVFYRWGAFRSSGRLNDVGEPEELVPNGKGQMVPDVRLPRFVLPEGIDDPFVIEPITEPQFPPDSVSLDQFKIESVLRFTNAGGRYKGRCQVSGLDVIVKEAKPHTGYVANESAIPRLKREVAILKTISDSFETITPSVIKQFSVQDHEYVALEYLPGIPLSEWIARENPLYSCLHTSSASVREYVGRASKILLSISDTLAKLHGLGIAFGDLSLGNVIVDKDDNARLIDFEACTSINDVVPGLRTPDFCLLHQVGSLTAMDRDTYAYHCIAISLILRLTSLAEISDHVLEAITKDLSKASDEVPRWWYEACVHLKLVSQQHSGHKASTFSAPTLDTLESRAKLRSLIARAALDCYSPGTEFVFPSSVAARKGAFLSHGFGCSGILIGLNLGREEIGQDIVLSYAKSVESSLSENLLPLNYEIGIAGILDTCSELALDDLFQCCMQPLIREWESLTNPSLATGLTGIALSLLRNGYAELAEEVMAKAIRLATEHHWKKNGLLYGRSGLIAGACQFDRLLKSRPELCAALQELVREEFKQVVRHPKGHSLSLRGEVDGTRLLPYLGDGTAGLLLSLLIVSENANVDFQLKNDDAIALSSDLGTPFMLEGSLMDGAAGLAIVLELTRQQFPEIADKIPDPGWNRIHKHLLPLRSGVGVLHPRSLKFDLSHAQGSIGILEALLWSDGISELNLSGLYLPRKNSSSA